MSSIGQNNNQEDVINFEEIFSKVIANWKLFVISAVICVGVAFVYLKITQPIYRIQSNILIKKEEKGSGAGALQSALTKNLGFGAFNMGSDVDDEVHVIASYSMIYKAIKELGLNKSYVLNRWGGLKKIDLYEDTPLTIACEDALLDTLSVGIEFSVKINKDGSGKIKSKIKKEKENYTFDKLPFLISTSYGKFMLNATPKLEAGKTYSMNINISGYPVSCENWQKRSSIGVVNKKSNAIHLGIEDVNAVRAKAFLDKVIELYNLDGISEKNIVAESTASFLDERLSMIYADLGESEKKVENYKTDNNLTDIPTEVKVMIEKSGDFNEKVLEVETQYSVIRLIEDYLKSPTNRYALVPANLGLQDKSIADALLAYNTLILERLKLSKTTNEHNPYIQVLNQQADAMRSNILLSVQSVKEGVRIHLSELKRQENIYRSRIKGLPSIEREYVDIKRQQMIKEQLYMFLLEKQEENNLAIAVAAPKAKIIDRAYVLSEPVSPKKMMILVIALVLGLGITAAYLYLKELLTTQFQYKEDVEKLTKLPIIGEIGVKTENAYVVVQPGSTSLLAEQFRLIRTNLPFIMTQSTDKVIMVTSTIQGEGKSFISANLSMSLSLLDKKVILLGYDIRSPKLIEYLGVTPKGKGVTGYLSSSSTTLEDIIIHDSKYPNLDLVPAGAIPPNPGELLMGKRVEEMFLELRKLYDYIIVDSAPVGLISDSFNLTRVVDITLYVTRANYSNKKNLTFANEMVEQGRLKKVSVVINGAKQHINRYGYGYGYGESTETAKKGTTKRKK